MERIAKCKICGAEFIQKQSNYTICSDECRKINMKEWQKQWDKRNPERKIIHNKNYRLKKFGYNKNRIGKKCRICNEVLKKACQTYCVKCILKNWKYSDKKTRWGNMMLCRGYDKEMMLDEIERLGI